MTCKNADVQPCPEDTKENKAVLQEYVNTDPSALGLLVLPAHEVRVFECQHLSGMHACPVPPCVPIQRCKGQDSHHSPLVSFSVSGGVMKSSPVQYCLALAKPSLHSQEFSCSKKNDDLIGLKIKKE